MGHALHTAGANILVNLVDALFWLNGNGSVRTGSGAGGALDTGLKLGSLLLKVPG